ncbi:hypothetical protein ACSLPA_33285, partial [Escherichia coli]
STAGSNSVFGRLVNAVSGLSDAAKAFLEASAPPLYFLLFLLFLNVWLLLYLKIELTLAL